MGAGLGRATMWPITIGILFSMMGLGLVAPVLPIYAREFGVSRTAAGALIAGFAVARLFFDAGGGFIFDKIGIRRVMVLGGVALSLSSVTAALAPNFTVLLLSRFVEGLGSAAFATGAQTLIVKQTQPDRIGRAMAVYQTGLLAGIAIGPIVGGYAAEWGDLTTPFWLYAVVGLIIAGIAINVPRDPVVSESGGRRARLEIASLLKSPAFLAVMFMAFALFVMRLGARTTLLPLYGSEEAGLSESDIGLIFGVSALVNLAVVIPAGGILDKAGRRLIAFWGLVLTAATMAAYGYATTLPILLAISVAFGVGSGFASVAAPTIAADLAKPGSEGATISLYRAGGDIGAIIGPLGLGAIAESVGFRLGFWVSAWLLLIAGVVILVAPESGGKDHPAAAARADPGSH